VLFRVLMEFEHPLLFQNKKKKFERTRRDAQKRKKKKTRERDITCRKTSDEKMKMPRHSW